MTFHTSWNRHATDTIPMTLDAPCAWSFEPLHTHLVIQCHIYRRHDAPHVTGRGFKSRVSNPRSKYIDLICENHGTSSICSQETYACKRSKPQGLQDDFKHLREQLSAARALGAQRDHVVARDGEHGDVHLVLVKVVICCYFVFSLVLFYVYLLVLLCCVYCLSTEMSTWQARRSPRERERERGRERERERERGREREREREREGERERERERERGRARGRGRRGRARGRGRGRGRRARHLALLARLLLEHPGVHVVGRVQLALPLENAPGHQ